MDYINIGNLKVKKGAALAPMAGLTDSTLRKLAIEYGAAFTVSEMVSAKAISFGDKKSFELCRRVEQNSIYGIQLFGCEPEIMATAAKAVLKYKPDFIDINMGCPAPKITTGGNGSALMKNPPLAAECVAATVNAVDIPVTVKMRTGWDDNSINCASLAAMCQQAGAAAICVHGRTRTQMYTPPIYPQYIKAVKQAVKIPVIGNGDIVTPIDAENMLKETGCDMVMVGRGVMGNLWLFAQIDAALNGTDCPKPPTVKQRLDLMKRHIYEMCEAKGESLAMREARTQAAFYLKGLRGAAKMRALTTSLTYYTDIEDLYKMALSLNP